jgi:AcrR family transcriptional regulator
VTRSRASAGRTTAADGAVVDGAVADGIADDTKERLLRAGESLFARDGIHRVPLREINARAGQRNPSALHYHFGSREGLVAAIMRRHQASIEAEMGAAIDELERRGAVTIRDVVAAVVRPLAAKLDTESGRNFLMLLPQITPALGRNLRRGVAEPSTPQSARVLELLRAHMPRVPLEVQRERQVAYVLLLSTLLADRAHAVESGAALPLDRARFEDHIVDLVEAMLTAPTTVPALPPVAAGPRPRSTRPLKR